MAAVALFAWLLALGLRGAFTEQRTIPDKGAH